MQKYIYGKTAVSTLLRSAVNCLLHNWEPLYTSRYLREYFRRHEDGYTKTVTVVMKGMSGPASRDNVFSGVCGGKTQKQFHSFHSF